MPTINSKQDSSNQITSAQNMIAGVKKRLTSPLTLAGSVFTIAQIVDALQARIDAIQAASVARAAWLAAVAHLNDEKASNALMLHALNQTVQAMFGTQTDVLADFGLVPHKRSAPKASTTADAVLKNAATRKARGTVGPKKKLSIKGNVPSNGSQASSSTAQGSAGSSTPPK
jgi:hypothetical protein